MTQSIDPDPIQPRPTPPYAASQARPPLEMGPGTPPPPPPPRGGEYYGPAYPPPPRRQGIVTRIAAGLVTTVLVSSLAMMFSIMASYARARAESLIAKCKVGFMERPERIVLFMLRAFTDRMAGVLWVILILSIVSVANRMHFTYLALNAKPVPRGGNAFTRVFWRAFFWTDERTTLPYDLWVGAILAFVWLTPPDWIRDPTAAGLGLWGWF